MPENEPEDLSELYEGVTEKTRTLPVRAIRQMEKAAKERDELRDRLATLERDRLFDQAGVPSDGVAAYFRSGYSGEPTPEAIAAAWQAVNPGGGQSAPDPALEGHQRAHELATGGEAPNAAPNVHAELQASLDRHDNKLGWSGFRDTGAGAKEVIQILQNAGIDPYESVEILRNSNAHR